MLKFETGVFDISVVPSVSKSYNPFMVGAQTYQAARLNNNDTDDRCVSGVHEYAGPHCCNATEGTRVDRQPHRISITIRHKY
jgi:hypothetical protein